MGGLVAGAAVGGAITGLPGIIAGPLVIVTVVIGFLVWMVGLLVLAAPAWWLLHRLKLRRWSAAMGLGAVLAPLPVMIMAIPAKPSAALFAWFGALSVLGAIVGLTVWLNAYRKPAEGAVC